jgi:UDPglucose--hexose-1-phosphate uridylyltransferase
VNQLRRNPLTRRWTIFTEGDLSIDELLERTRRAAATAQPRSADPCPFCPGNEAMTPEEILVWHDGAMRYRRDHGPAGSAWEARVFPNRNPLFRVEGALGRRAQRNYDVINAIGASEIIVESTTHKASWQEVDLEMIRRALVIYRERMRELARNPDVGHQALYKHVGLRRASQIVHPYSQLVAAPVVPEVVRQELDSFRLHYRQKERCLACDIIREVDRTSADCKIVDNAAFTAFVPYFAPHPFEVWVTPRRHQAWFTDLADEEIDPAAEVLWTALRKLDHVVGSLAMTLTVHTGPNPRYSAQRGYWDTIADDYHWRFVIIPRLPVLADVYRGFVMGTGLDVNPIYPEHAGLRLKDAAV